MRTLDNWAHRLLQVPLLIECPSMQVIGYDHEEPLFVGPGHISITSRTGMEFVMHGKPIDEKKAHERLFRAFENPFVNLDQLRVMAVDYEGVEWNCGWVDVRIGDTAQGIWRLSGNIQVIMTKASGTRVQAEASIEVVYDAKRICQQRLHDVGGRALQEVLIGTDFKRTGVYVHHRRPFAQCSQRKLRRGEYHTGRAYRQEQVAALSSRKPCAPGVFREHLTEPHDTRANKAVTCAAPRRLDAASVMGQILVRQDRAVSDGAVDTSWSMQTPMNVDHALTSGTLVKIVDILSNE